MWIFHLNSEEPLNPNRFMSTFERLILYRLTRAYPQSEGIVVRAWALTRFLHHPCFYPEISPYKIFQFHSSLWETHSDGSSEPVERRVSSQGEKKKNQELEISWILDLIFWRDYFCYYYFFLVPVDHHGFVMVMMKPCLIRLSWVEFPGSPACLIRDVTVGAVIN